MKKAERTRQHILEQTAPIFNQKGFDGTSVADLTRATGLTKGALYGNFKDKEEIAEEAFQYAIRRVSDRVQNTLLGRITFKQQLLGLLDFYAEYVFDPPVKGGCPLLNTAVDADDHIPFMRNVVVDALMSTVGFIRDLIEKGIEEGEFNEDVDANALAYVLFCSIEGAVMFSRAEGSREPMDIIVAHCRRLLEGISVK